MRKLTKEQRVKWVTDGYIQLEQVLSPDEVTLFSNEIDAMRKVPGYEPRPGELPRGHYGWVEQTPDQDPEGFMDRRDILSYHDAFIALIDRPEIFELIVDIMGPYILFSMSQAIVRASTDEFPGYTHTDGGEALRRIRVTETSLPLAMKAMYLLSDITGTDCGNFTVYPGSHLRPYPEDNTALNPHAPGTVQLTGKAGDCYLFAHSLWHGPAPNHAGKGRKTLLYNYCQMFVRWYDFASISDVRERCTPRQRRLLGDLGYDFRPGSYFYSPPDQLEVIGGGTPS
ncbi:MAG: hypothetical protein CFH40_00457 [Alphaproteobacteria bacterium MarineAlpha10_Bin3]|nr:MAG: hypothetical protein CFH40_00457 [Alphaproteobacteria bacterium MarineAlpha10_Bin3]PPR74807.1 MAG: hypothetical protein CFH09_00457 [Alphaproteobacteria bacterium MarineAlpha4_Bin1]